MRQVLLWIPLKADWLPGGVPLYVVLLLLFLAVAGALWGAARFAGRWKLDPQTVRAAASWVAIGGGLVALLAYFFGETGLPIYGFGMMLFLAFLICNWVAGRRAEHEGVSKETVQDVAIWCIIGGLIGARLTSFLSSGEQSKDLFDFLYKFIRIWDGGIVLYGAVIGGLATYVVAYWLVFRKKKVPTFKFCDILAPSLALGLCIGRVGCFLNGCCYGQVACANCPVCGVSFPLSAPPRYELVQDGYQTAAGFTLEGEDFKQGKIVVKQVEPKSDAYGKGLLPGDVIQEVDPGELNKLFTSLQADVDVETNTIEVRPGMAFLPHHHLVVGSEVMEVIQVQDAPVSFPFGLLFRGQTITVKRGVEGTTAAPHNRRDAVYTKIDTIQATASYLGTFARWPRGKNDLTLVVQGKPDPITIVPWTVPLHPTQLYETISMALLFLLLTAYYPFRRRDGQVMAVLMVCYSVHRYLNELLRADERPVGFESWFSVALFAAGVILWVWLQRQPAQYRPGAATPVPEAKSSAPPVQSAKA